MSIVTEEGIADELGLTAEVAYRVHRHVLEAGVYLRTLKGDTWYQDMSLAAVSPRPRQAGNETARTRAERAEALLALYYALPLLNLSLADAGGVLAVVYDTTEAGTIQTRFATSEGLDGLRRDLLVQAKLLVSGDVVTRYSGEGESTVIESVEGYGRGGYFGAI